MRYDWAAPKTGRARARRRGAALRSRAESLASRPRRTRRADGTLNLLAVDFREDRSAVGHGASSPSPTARWCGSKSSASRRAARHRPAPARGGLPRPRADRHVGGLKAALERNSSMPVALDMGAADFEPRFRALLAAKREVLGRRRRHRRGDHRRCARARRRGADRIFAALRPRRSRALGLAVSAAEIDAALRRLRARRARRARIRA